MTPDDPPKASLKSMILPLGVCAIGGLIGALLKGAGNTSIAETVLLFLSFIALVVVVGLVLVAIERMR